MVSLIIWRKIPIFIYFSLAMSLALFYPVAKAAAPEVGDIYFGGSQVEYPDRRISDVRPIEVMGTVSEQNFKRVSIN